MLVITPNLKGKESAIVIQADSFSQSILSRRVDQIYFSALSTLSSFTQQYNLVALIKGCKIKKGVSKMVIVEKWCC